MFKSAHLKVKYSFFNPKWEVHFIIFMFVWTEQEEKERIEREKREQEMREYQERVKKLEEVERKKRQRELEIEERERRREEERRNLEDSLSRKVNNSNDGDNLGESMYQPYKSYTQGIYFQLKI